MFKGSSIPFWLSVLVSALIFVWFPYWAVDDAFIVFRYAKNWVDSGQPVWNPGEDPVEGYTGQIWLILATILFYFDQFPIQFLMGLGIASHFGLLFLLHQSSKKLKLPNLVSSAVVFLFALSPLSYLHAKSGLETTFFAFLLSWAALFFLKTLQDSEENNQTALKLYLVATLLCLTRPDGLLPALVFIALSFFSHTSEKKPILAFRFLYLFVAFILPLSLVFYLRISFYGHFFSNTAYAKAYQDGWINLASLKDAARFFFHHLFLPLLAGGIMALVRLKKGSWSKGDPIRIWSIGLMLVVLGWILAYGRTHLWMGYGYRFFFPLYPLLLLLFAVFFSRGIKLIPSARRKIYLGGLFALMAVQGILLGRQWKVETSWVIGYENIRDQALRPVAKLGQELVHGDERVAVMMDVGMIGYGLMNSKVLDLGYLNNEELAHTQPTPEALAGYVMNWNPDFIIFTSWSPDQVNYIPEAKAITQHPDFKQYNLLESKPETWKKPHSPHPAYYQLVYGKINQGNWSKRAHPRKLEGSGMIFCY